MELTEFADNKLALKDRKAELLKVKKWKRGETKRYFNPRCQLVESSWQKRIERSYRVIYWSYSGVNWISPCTDEVHCWLEAWIGGQKVSRRRRGWKWQKLLRLKNDKSRMPLERTFIGFVEKTMKWYRWMTGMLGEWWKMNWRMGV